MTNLFLLVPLALGVIASLPFLAYARAKGRKMGHVIAVGLIVTAAIYVAFALAGGGTRGVLVESLGLVIFTAFAIGGVRLWPELLALGWTLHVVWDLTRQPVPTEELALGFQQAQYVPWWYPSLCVGFDLFVAGFVAASIWRAATPGGATEVQRQTAAEPAVAVDER